MAQVVWVASGVLNQGAGSVHVLVCLVSLVICYTEVNSVLETRNVHGEELALHSL